MSRVDRQKEEMSKKNKTIAIVLIITAIAATVTTVTIFSVIGINASNPNKNVVVSQETFSIPEEVYVPNVPSEPAISEQLSTVRVIEVDASEWITTSGGWSTTNNANGIFSLRGTIMYVNFPAGVIPCYQIIVDEMKLSTKLGKPLYCVNMSSVVFKGLNAGSKIPGMTTGGIGFIFKYASSWWICANTFSSVPSLDNLYWPQVKECLIQMSDSTPIVN